MDVDAPSRRLDYELVLSTRWGERVISKGTADAYNPVLAELGVGEAAYSFHVHFPDPLRDDERDSLIVRTGGTRFQLPLAPMLKTVFEPISHVAMDIVNNCNLRCPFCVYDYSATFNTELMTDATFDAAVKLLPYTTDGNFWLSCLHEATLHPALLDFIDRVPVEYRHKLMYTTNLAKRMPESYFTALARSGLHHLNISLESFEPALYERMRKGARHRIFMENWSKLLAAFADADAPPALRYNIMAYRSNLRELPGMVEVLLGEKQAAYIEIRATMPVGHIPPDFLASELLGAADWTWLREQLAAYPNATVNLIIPPNAMEENVTPEESAADLEHATQPETAMPDVPADGRIPRPLNMRIDWDGQLILYGERPGYDGLPQHTNYRVLNVKDISDPHRFLISV